MTNETFTDPREMRKMLNDMRRSGRSFTDHTPDQYSTTAHLVRQCLNAAEYQGWSGEDAMTLLAYSALTQLERVNKLLLDQAMVSMPKMIFTKGEKP